MICRTDAGNRVCFLCEKEKLTKSGYMPNESGVLKDNEKITKLHKNMRSDE